MNGASVGTTTLPSHQQAIQVRLPRDGQHTRAARPHPRNALFDPPPAGPLMDDVDGAALPLAVMPTEAQLFATRASIYDMRYGDAGEAFWHKRGTGKLQVLQNAESRLVRIFALDRKSRRPVANFALLPSMSMVSSQARARLVHRQQAAVSFALLPIHLPARSRPASCAKHGARGRQVAFGRPRLTNWAASRERRFAIRRWRAHKPIRHAAPGTPGWPRSTTTLLGGTRKCTWLCGSSPSRLCLSSWRQ